MSQDFPDALYRLYACVHSAREQMKVVLNGCAAIVSDEGAVAASHREWEVIRDLERGERNLQATHRNLQAALNKMKKGGGR